MINKYPFHLILKYNINVDAEVPLMCPGSPALICETSSVTVVSVVMRRESLLDDEDD